MGNSARTSLAGGFLKALRGLLSTGAETANACERSEFEALKRKFNTSIVSLRQMGSAKSVGQKVAEGAREPSASARKDPDPHEIYRRACEESKNAMRREIESLHEKLGTGVNPASLDELQHFLLSFEAIVNRKNPEDIEDQLRQSTLQAILERSGEIAWKRLIERMGAAGVEWPEPHGLAHDATDDVRRMELERMLCDLRATFLSIGLRPIAELVTGLISAWKLSYPPPGSWLWRQVALRGVAAGIKAQVVRRVIHCLQPEEDEIAGEVSATLKSQLATLEAAARSPGGSVEEIDRMLRSAGGAIEAVTMERVFERVEPILQEEMQK